MFFKRIKRSYKILLWIIFFCIVVTAVCNIYVNLFAAPHLYYTASDIPENEFGLVLGTSKFTEDGDTNYYFQNRVEATAYLFSSGKIKQIICSGDNRDKYYNEPKALSKALRQIGIPDSVMWLDKKGINTNQSMKNFIKDYNTQSLTIITQKFHNQRAVFLARKSGLDAVGFIANDVDFLSGIPTQIREWFAKVKAVFVTIFK